ncbi:hypothetical protein Dimus_019503 [Dionaea muscipula]
MLVKQIILRTQKCFWSSASAHQTRGFFSQNNNTHINNEVSKYLARAKLIDAIRLRLRSGSYESLLAILQHPNLDSFVITNAIKSAPSPHSALFFVKSLEGARPRFSQTKHTSHAIAKVLAKSSSTNELRELIDAINAGKFRRINPNVSFMDRMRWYALAQDLDSVLCVWDELKKHVGRPCTEAYNILMDLYARKKGKDLDAVQTFYRMIQQGGIPNSRTYTVMMWHLVNSGKLEAAKGVFDVLPSMRVRRTSKQYSLLLDAFCNNQQFDVVKSLLCEMQVDGSLPKRCMLPLLLTMHGAGYIEETSELITMMLPDDRIQKVEFCMGDSDDEGKDDDEDDVVDEVQLKPWLDPRALANALRYWRPEDVSILEDAKIVWTPRLVCKMLRHFKSAERAWEFFCWVSYQPEFTHDVHTLSRMMTKLARCGDFDLVLQLISKVKKEGIKLGFSTVRMIIDFYGLSKNGDAALEVFRQVKALCAPISKFNTSILYSSLLRTLTKCGRSNSDVMDIVEEMISSNIHPDIQTFSGLMHHFASEGDFRTVQRLFAMARQSGVDPDGYMYKILIHAYCKCERAALALRLFEDMTNFNLVPDRATKSLLVKSLWKEGKLREAAMVEEGCEEISDVLPLALPGHLFTVSSTDLTKIYTLYSGSFT